MLYVLFVFFFLPLPSCFFLQFSVLLFAPSLNTPFVLACYVERFLISNLRFFFFFSQVVPFFFLFPLPLPFLPLLAVGVFPRFLGLFDLLSAPPRLVFFSSSFYLLFHSASRFFFFRCVVVISSRFGPPRCSFDAFFSLFCPFFFLYSSSLHSVDGNSLFPHFVHSSGGRLHPHCFFFGFSLSYLS